MIECDAAAIVDVLKLALKEFSLDINQMCGLGTDNANVMVGVNNGVIKKLQDINPNIILIPCVCHSLQLCVSSAAKECLPRNLEYLISETYNWFAHSTLRRNAYLNVYKCINDGHDPLKIVQSCATRWLSIESAVVRIVQQWLELKTHFQMVRVSEKCYNAEMLFQSFNDESNLAYLLFLKPVLGEVQRVNKSFESNDADVTKLLEDLFLLLTSLIKKICVINPNFDMITSKLEQNLLPNSYLGYEFEQKMNELRFKIDNFDEVGLRTRCVNFLMKLIHELRNRMPKNIKILKKITMFAVENALKQIKEPLIPLLKEFKYSLGEITKIENQWRNLTTVQWSNLHTTSDFWIEVKGFTDSCKENPFQELADLALSFLVLPLSNAEVERSFSQMNLIKTKQRNKMCPTTLNGIMTVRAGLKRLKKCCFDVDVPEEVIKMIGNNSTYDKYESNNNINMEFDFHTMDN